MASPAVSPREGEAADPRRQDAEPPSDAAHLPAPADGGPGGRAERAPSMRRQRRVMDWAHEAFDVALDVLWFWRR